MTCCNCWNNFTEYIKSFFVKNEEQIKTEMIILELEKKHYREIIEMMDFKSI